MVIGTCEQREGVYYLQGMNFVTIVAVKSKNDFDLWHRRLGHPSCKVVGLIPNIGVSRNNALCNKTCDVCLRAKQCRETFPLIINKTVEIVN